MARTVIRFTTAAPLASTRSVYWPAFRYRIASRVPAAECTVAGRPVGSPSITTLASAPAATSATVRTKIHRSIGTVKVCGSMRPWAWFTSSSSQQRLLRTLTFLKAAGTPGQFTVASPAWPTGFFWVSKAVARIWYSPGGRSLTSR